MVKRKLTLTGLWTEYGKQFLRFCCVGIVNTAVDYAVFWLSNRLLGESFLLGDKNYLIAQLLGFAAGTLNAYFMNGSFVFRNGQRKRNRGSDRLVRSYIGYGFTFAMSEVLLWLLVSKAGVDKYIAKILILCVTVPLNFVINRFWIFKNVAEES